MSIRRHAKTHVTQLSKFCEFIYSTLCIFAVNVVDYKNDDTEREKHHHLTVNKEGAEPLNPYVSVHFHITCKNRFFEATSNVFVNIVSTNHNVIDDITDIGNTFLFTFRSCTVLALHVKHQERHYIYKTFERNFPSNHTCTR